MTSKEEILQIERQSGERRNDLRREFNQRLIRGGSFGTVRDPLSNTKYRWEQYKRKQRSRKLRKLHEQQGSRNLSAKTPLHSIHKSGSRNIFDEEED